MVYILFNDTVCFKVFLIVCFSIAIYPLMPSSSSTHPYAAVSVLTFHTLESVGLSQAHTLLGRPSSDNAKDADL